MADISNLKINESSNVERLKSIKSEIKIEKLKHRNWYLSKVKYENCQNSE